MPEDRLCGHCRAWMCCGDDAWCGSCGQSCSQLELVANPAVLHLGDQPPRLSFKLTNTTCAEIAVQRIDRPTWLLFPAEQVAAIAPGQTAGMLVGAKIDDLLQPTATEVIFASTVGEVSVRVMAIDRNPKMVCVPELIEAWSGPHGEHSRSRIAISPAGGMLRIRNVSLRGVAGTVGVKMLKSGFVASPSAAMTADIEIHAERLTRGPQLAMLDVIFDGPHGPETVGVPIRINVRRPPQLRWAGAHERPILRHQTDRQSLALVFHNQSPDLTDGGSENGDLVIEAITLTPSRGMSVPIRRLTGLPATVPGGESHTAEFELNLTGLQGKAAGIVEFGLTVRTNLPVLGTRERTVALRVEPLKRFEGVVAIDFGSSNTCCAVLEPGGVPELLALDRENLVSPTVVRYVDLSQTPPAIETGELVRNAAAGNAEVAASVAEGLKRKLRDKRQEIDIRPAVPRKWLSRNASEAAADYLRNLRQLAEVRKSSLFQRFILTHPARCPLRQHQRLSAALTQAFGSSGSSVSFISEPIAALVPYIARRAQGDNRASYTVASFDLGGGTTDVAIVRVQYRTPAPDLLEIEPEVLFCKGVDFGGEDLTEYLKTELETRCQELLRTSGADAVVLNEAASSAAPLDVRRNRFALREAAERFKASMNNPPSVKQPETIMLRVRQKDGRTVNYPFDFAKVSVQSGSSLCNKFLEHATARVMEVAKMLTSALAAKNLSLDVIQLSGKTALLPLVREAIKESFRKISPAIPIEQEHEPKECVVRGACLSLSMRTGTVRLCLPDSMERMTSSVGTFPVHGAYFLPLLKADAPIPAEGLRGECGRFWNGLEPVVLWEDVDGDDRPIQYADAAKHLEKMGTWEPERHVETLASSGASVAWTLRVTVKKFQLTVEAVAPDGEIVLFHPMNRTGE